MLFLLGTVLAAGTGAGDLEPMRCARAKEVVRKGVRRQPQAGMTCRRGLS